MGWARELINLRGVVNGQAKNLERKFEEKLPEEFATWWELEGQNLIREILLKTGHIFNYIITNPGRFDFKSLGDLKSAFEKILQPAWQDFTEIHVRIDHDVLKISFTVV